MFINLLTFITSPLGTLRWHLLVTWARKKLLLEAMSGYLQIGLCLLSNESNAVVVILTKQWAGIQYCPKLFLTENHVIFLKCLMFTYSLIFDGVANSRFLLVFPIFLHMICNIPHCFLSILAFPLAPVLPSAAPIVYCLWTPLRASSISRLQTLC